MDRTTKKTFVAELRDSVSSAQLVVLTSPAGMTVAEMYELRQQMREAGAQFKVVKNTLAHIAIEGSPFASLQPHLKGPIAFAYSRDPVAAAKVVAKYAKGNSKLSIVGGALGSRVLAQSDVEALAKLPSLDEMRARVLAVIQTPATQLASVLQAPARQVVQVVSAYSKKS